MNLRKDHSEILSVFTHDNLKISNQNTLRSAKTTLESV